MKRSASELSGKLRRLSARIWDPSGRGGRDRDRGHHLPASLAAHDEDWDPDQPQIRMSRAFAVMLILHLVAVGGLFAFHVFGKDDQNAEQLATRQAHANATPPPPRAEVVSPSTAAPNASGVPAGSTPPRAEVVAENTAVDAGGNQVHTMLAGESKSLIAAKYSLSVRELEEANPGVDVGKTGAKVVIPSPHQQRVIGATPAEGHNGNAPVAVIAATNGDEPGAREFAMKGGPESPYQNYDHEGAAAKAAAPVPSNRSSQVSAKPVEAKPSKTKEKTSTRPSDRPATRDRDDDDGDRPAKTKTQQASSGSKPKPASTGSRTHVVKSGDTVYNISRRYGMSASEVMRANNISDASKLQLGQVLKISNSR